MTNSSLPSEGSTSSKKTTRAFDYLQAIRRSFSYSQVLLYYLFIATVAVSTVGLLQIWNKSLMVLVPMEGGQLTEGVIGTPRFVNPVLAVSDADRDLTTLFYSGLLRVSKEGDLIPDLARSYTVSEDGLVYTFTLKPEAVFHDGHPVTSADVRYTIERTQDPVIKSPRRASWDGVTIATPDPLTVVFRLKQPYAAFMDNATIGILPRHLWEKVSSELFAFHEANLLAVGSGPYRLARVRKDSNGTPLSYDLQAFAHFTLGKPRVSTLTLAFYQNEDDLVRAFLRKDVDAAAALSPQLVEHLRRPDVALREASLPRVFALFLNQNQNKIFSQPEVRHALDLALDKEALIARVLNGYGTPLQGPLPPGSLGFSASLATTTLRSADRLLQAQAILQKAGWKLNDASRVMEYKTGAETRQLRFTITTVNTDELTRAAEYVAAVWRQIGAEGTVATYELGDFNQNSIRTRKYESLLFGEIVGRDPDLFSFWHSSQRNDPGLNIALYTNVQMDALLEKMRAEHELTERLKLAQTFNRTLMQEVPAIFLYSPSFLYALPKRLQGTALAALASPTERFLHVHEWYLEEELVWPFFKTN